MAQVPCDESIHICKGTWKSKRGAVLLQFTGLKGALQEGKDKKKAFLVKWLRKQKRDF